jgi:hypothetical protein
MCWIKIFPTLWICNNYNMLEERVIDSRNRESFLYSREITKPFGELDRVIDWCKTELVGDWRWQLVDVSSDRRPGRYVFYFDSERDFFAFTLQWS